MKKRLLNLVFLETEPAPNVACSSPHQIFIFCDQKGVPKRTIEVCFPCNGLRTTPALPEAQYKKHDFTALAHFVNELGLWAPYSDIKDYAPCGTPDYFEKQ